MSRGARINLALLALAAVLALLIRLSPDNDPQQEITPLTRQSPEEVRKITVSNHHGSFTLERRDGDWRMTAPDAAEANAERIADLLMILSTPSYQQFPLSEVDLTDFGLQPPTASIRIDRLTLELGEIHPYNQRRYLRLGDTLHLINDRFPHHFLARAAAFVSPRPPLESDAGQTDSLTTDN